MIEAGQWWCGGSGAAASAAFLAVLWTAPAITVTDLFLNWFANLSSALVRQLNVHDHNPTTFRTLSKQKLNNHQLQPAL